MEIIWSWLPEHVCSFFVFIFFVRKNSILKICIVSIKNRMTNPKKLFSTQDDGCSLTNLYAVIQKKNTFSKFQNLNLYLEM